MIHFLIVEDYELSKIAIYILSVPLTLEWLEFYLYPSLFSALIFSMIMFSLTGADDTALNSSCDKRSDLSQQVEIGYEL